MALCQLVLARGDQGEQCPLQVLGRETHDGGAADASAEPEWRSRAARGSVRVSGETSVQPLVLTGPPEGP